uniref:CHCH domain-containing protein n=1 Tax=Anopheles christyi TaxID=43041 RepID=A0A182K642_9DIPT
MPRRDTRARPVPPSRKSTDTKSQHGTEKSTTGSASEPTKTAPATAAIPTPAAPGLFSQMAATAGGVAIGSVLGRALGGLFERSEPKESSTDAVVKEKQTAMEAATVSEKSSPMEECNLEIKQFLSCIDKEVDAKICEGFKEAMQQCKSRASSRTSPVFHHA